MYVGVVSALGVLYFLDWGVYNQYFEAFLGGVFSSGRQPLSTFLGIGM